MSEITQPPPDLNTQDGNSRVHKLDAATDQSPSEKRPAEQQPGRQQTNLEQEKHISQHDPAVTLASTLSKLNSGSYFNATVSGKDSEGRTIITSELGTYLINAEKTHVGELDKIQKEAILNIRVVTIGQKITAEIIRPPNDPEISLRPVIIPVSLILTDLGQNLGRDVLNSSTPTRPLLTPLDDVRSQYQATTLYKAERIAREIGDKLDSLPLPTSSPNYTVYGAMTGEKGSTSAIAPKQISANVFIQEVTTPEKSSSINITNPSILNNILGQNLNVEVIRAIPKTPIDLPAGLPQSVIKEISALTPIDYVQVGQNFNINIVAIAVPEQNENIIKNLPLETQTPIKKPKEPQAVTQSIPITHPVTATQIAPAIKAIKDAVISGIIIDTSQKPITQNTISTAKPIINTPYGQNTNTVTPNNYFLATPTAVLKFQSDTPLISGTIVSFTVQSSKNPQQQSNAKNNTFSIQNNTVTTPHPIPPASKQFTNNISPSLSDKIDNFIPQDLNQLPQDWASISLALSALSSTASAAMNTAFTSRIPNMQSPEQLTSTIFFFLSALKSPHPARTWIGPDVANRLKQISAAKTLDRMDNDFSRIARLGGETPVGEWRPLLIPYQSGTEISAIHMLTKQIIDDEQKKKAEQEGEEDIDIKATRFILEINFSNFGNTIIDGMLKERRLDIILKSTGAIPINVKIKLSAQFDAALKNNTFEGELVVIDKTQPEISVKKIIESMNHKQSLETKI